MDSIDLSGFNPEDQGEVQQLITREADVYSIADFDICSSTSVQLEIKLQDTTPAQLNYHSVPKPLHAELKVYIENLYNKGWIINSSSSFSSQVVSVRKKDGLLRVCCDHRQRNSKNIPDRYPLPKRQNILENLERSQYFCIFNQGKKFTIESLLVLKVVTSQISSLHGVL